MNTAVSESIEQRQYRTFFVDGDEYGVDLLRVLKIRACERVTPIPSTRNYVRGVISLRGVVVPIVDLGRRLGRELPELSAGVVIVMNVAAAGSAERIVGFVVDAVSDVCAVTDVEPPPDLGSARACFHNRRCPGGGKIVILLDADQLADGVAAG